MPALATSWGGWSGRGLAGVWFPGAGWLPPESARCVYG